MTPDHYDPNHEPDPRGVSWWDAQRADLADLLTMVCKEYDVTPDQTYEPMTRIDGMAVVAATMLMAARLDQIAGAVSSFDLSSFSLMDLLRR